MTLTLDIFKETVEELPSDDALKRAAGSALAAAAEPSDEPCEIALRLVDAAEMRALNGQFRGRDYATNVLSFPADLPVEVDLKLLGDIVICAPVVREEAAAQGKALAAHWDHMLVHGVLHLLGYDHESDLEAERMESLEIRILADLDWPSPYESAEEITHESRHGQATPSREASPRKSAGAQAVVSAE